MAGLESLSNFGRKRLKLEGQCLRDPAFGFVARKLSALTSVCPWTLSVRNIYSQRSSAAESLGGLLRVANGASGLLIMSRKRKWNLKHSPDDNHQASFPAFLLGSPCASHTLAFADCIVLVCRPVHLLNVQVCPPPQLRYWRHHGCPGSRLP